MATESNSAGDKLVVHLDGVRHELIVRVRYGEPQISGEALSSIAAATVGAWLRAWRAIHDDTWNVGVVESPEKKYLTEGQYEQRKEQRKYGAEPYTTVFNKTFDGLSLTVHSHDNGQQAVTAAAAFVTMKEALAEKMPQLFQAPQHASKQAEKRDNEASSRDLSNVDSFLQDNTSELPQITSGDLPFRKFKRIADTVIQLQEFVQGGGGKDKYQKSATKAELPYHKSNVQYDEDSLVYYAITGAIQIKEGQYGTQAIIPTDKGRVYVDMNNKNGEESPDWHNFAQDLGNEYQRLVNDDSASFFAPNCVLVLKNSKHKDNKQWKNFYRIYSPLNK